MGGFRIIDPFQGVGQGIANLQSALVNRQQQERQARIDEQNALISQEQLRGLQLRNDQTEVTQQLEQELEAVTRANPDNPNRAAINLLRDRGKLLQAAKMEDRIVQDLLKRLDIPGIDRGSVFEEINRQTGSNLQYDPKRDVVQKVLSDGRVAIANLASGEVTFSGKAKPVILSPGARLTDPTTGEAIASAPFRPFRPDTTLTPTELFQKDPEAFAEMQDIIARKRARHSKTNNSLQSNQELIQAVLKNPKLFQQLTATQKGRIAGPLAKMGFKDFGKPLSDTAITKISEAQDAVRSLKDLRVVISNNRDKIGPAKGLLALNPFSEARKIQADIDRVRQRIGKALEGGVLRKEDEIKYKKILATITDVPETALYKIDQLLSDLENQIENFEINQRLAGRNVNTTSPPTNNPFRGAENPFRSKRPR